MPEYLSPGVYVEEVPSGPRPIEGVGTSTAGIVGPTERGPTTPRLITNWGQFRRWYGDIVPVATSFTPYAARGFFENGGVRLFVARVTRNDATSAAVNLATVTAGQQLRIEAVGAGGWGNQVFMRVAASTRLDNLGNPVGFRLTLLYFRTLPNPFVDPLNPANFGNPNRVEPDAIEDYDDLSVDPLDGNYVLNRVNGNSTLVHASWTNNALATGAPNLVAFAPLAGGGDGANPLTAVEYEGNPALPPDQRTGLAALEIIDEIALLLIPDEVHPSLNAANQSQLMNTMVTQCERLADRFAVLNVPSGQGLVQNIFPPRDTSYAAIYYPWIRVFDPFTRDTVLVPPAGHVAGIYARTDRDRGVHKAPANEVVRDIITRDINATRRPLEFTLARADQDILNPRGINVIRDFRADRRGIRVWGARTLSGDPLWRYVNVRRLFNYVKESVDEGTQWVVFEPNDEETWARVRQVVTDFLTLVWRSGALFGATEEQAFFVRCGPDTMTAADIDAGRLIVEVGIAPVKPAEFVIFRFQQKTAELATS